MLKRRTVWVGLVAAALAMVCPASRAQDPKEIVQQAVNAELTAGRDDRSLWRFLQHESDGDLFVVVQTRDGYMKRHVDEHGHPASRQTLATDDAENERFAHDPALQAKQRRDGLHDDRSATELLKEMPVAFVWTVQSENGEGVTLSYHPNPEFTPPSMESRVMSAMTGTMVVSKPGHRIRTFKGRLMDDVTFGFGLFARIKTGSTFDVERREIRPGLWQITETHVHVNGHALFFKTIGQQQDEINSNFTQVPQNTTLEQALPMLLDAPK